MNEHKEHPISDLLRQTIVESGVPYLVLQKATGVVRSSIMRFVEHRQSLRLDAADRLAEYFGLRLTLGPGGRRAPTKKRRVK
jgi:plasmid maintenance system antidote protein VapI